MLQSHFINDKLTASFPLDNNWPPKRTSKMSDHPSRHHSSPFPTSTGRSSPYDSVEGDIDALEIITPRSYSHSPAPIPPSTGTDGAELQPWLYQLFPESYADTSSYSLSAPTEGQYLPGPDGTLIYQSPVMTSRSIVGQTVLHTSPEESIYSSAGS